MTGRVTTRLAYSLVVLYVLLVGAAMAIASRLDLIEAIRSSMQPAHTSLWLRGGPP